MSVNLGFILTQDIRDLELMQSLVSYLNCGGTSLATDGLSCEFHVYRLQDIVNIIIPFFNIHPLRGVKSLDFADFVKGVNIVQGKEHLTDEGLQKITTLKDGMNKGRI